MLIANGIDEEEACAQAVVPYPDFMAAEFTNQDFMNKLQAAVKRRGDYWAHKVMKTIDEEVTKDEAPGKKIQFEKLKWLAKIDNPDKYGEKSTQTIDIRHNISHTMKNMSIADARKILNADPFSVKEEPIEAELVDKPKEYSL